MDTSSFTLSLVVGASAGLYFFQTAHEPGALEQDAQAPAAKKDDADVCRHHVRNLRARLQLYRKENGRLPDRLEQLEAKWLEPENFVVPGHGETRYVYVGPKGEGAVLLYGCANGADGLVTVLKTNLKIERVSAQELERLRAQRGSR
jgi:hypothetical protein